MFARQGFGQLCEHRHVRRHLVHLNPVEVEVRVYKRGGVLVDIVNANSWASRIWIDRAGPVSAERQVDDDVRRTEFTVDVALGVRVVRGRGAPSIRFDRAGAVQHVRRDVTGTVRPEPDLYERRSTLDRVPPAAIAVEPGSIAVGCSCLYTTTCVAVCKCVAV